MASELVKAKFCNISSRAKGGKKENDDIRLLYNFLVTVNS